MIAGKNDDRGATEFYDNLGFKISSSIGLKLEHLLRNRWLLKKVQQMLGQQRPTQVS